MDPIDLKGSRSLFLSEIEKLMLLKMQHNILSIKNSLNVFKSKHLYGLGNYMWPDS